MLRTLLTVFLLVTFARADETFSLCELEYPKRIKRSGFCYHGVHSIIQLKEGEDLKKWNSFFSVNVSPDYSVSEFTEWIRESTLKRSKDQFPGLDFGKKRSIDLASFSEEQISNANGVSSTLIEMVYYDKDLNENFWFMYLIERRDHGIRFWTFGEKDLKAWGVDTLSVTSVPTKRMSDFKTCFVKASKELKYE